jgi:hypothetical protein
MQTTSGDSNCTQLLRKIFSSFLRHPPLSFIYSPSLSTTADVQLFVQMLQLLVLHTVVRRHISHHNLTMQVKPCTMSMPPGDFSSCSTHRFLLQKVREKIAQMIKLKVESYKTFRKELKSFLLRHTFYSVEEFVAL